MILQLALLFAAQRTDAQTMALIPLPPVRFRGDITSEVHFVEPSKLPTLCGMKIEAGQVLLGCARSQPRQIFISNPCLSIDQLYARELCHELGHLREGWEDHGP